ncbi:MAG: bifunctional diaminohydroxyphosphoribosylaminopyrimidine deaminase/5-amino-6-(5-phosphoribosylamino)uracil reductase RibD [Gammaproteobacteria bacterium]|nr:bifunctional diaminohydroxyphosphoribosylaminopyrimidine deaminase/5-amino-6-(5-phosphoribosylamino)uracil reductase RibD [Gammaproteobacteria bacterium]
MRRSLELAARGLFTTDPNPRVGCVLAAGGQIIAEGWHERAGEAHAEVRALQVAGASARGATAYVSLEPCAHQGRTPPCTAALIGAGVVRVVYALEDPNPRAQGGAAALRAAGIGVAGGLLAAESEALNPGYLKRMRQSLPFVRVKLGASLDGRTALASGESRWITGKRARQDAQRYRARSSAVLTGIDTVLADDPALNVRIEEEARQPLRVVLDSTLRLPPQARLIEREGAPLVFSSAAALASSPARATLAARGVRLEALPLEAPGRLSLVAALRRLAELECNEVWVEAGARLAGALLAAGLVDELVVYLAPRLLGHAARPLAELPPPASLAAAAAFRFTECVPIGGDVRLIARPLPPAEP